MTIFRASLKRKVIRIRQNKSELRISIPLIIFRDCFMLSFPPLSHTFSNLRCYICMWLPLQEFFLRITARRICFQTSFPCRNFFGGIVTPPPVIYNGPSVTSWQKSCFVMYSNYNFVLSLACKSSIQRLASNYNGHYFLTINDSLMLIFQSHFMFSNSFKRVCQN